MWSQVNVVSNECGHNWKRSRMNGLKLMWSQTTVVSNDYGHTNERGLKRMWSQMKKTHVNVTSNEQVSNECCCKLMWAQMNRSQMWSQMKLFSNEVVSNEWSQMNSSQLSAPSPTRGGCSPTAVPGPARVYGPHEPQSSKLKRTIIHKDFIVKFYLYSLVQINWLKLLFQSLYNVSPFLLVSVWENLNLCCFVASPMH